MEKEKKQEKTQSSYIIKGKHYKMKFTLSFFIFSFLLVNISQAQVFNGTGGAIPDSGSVQGIFPLTVSGIGNINANIGVVSICMNINHPWTSDLEIYLVAPDGTSVPLSIQNGGSGQNYTNTCFSGTALNPVADATAPFTGTFIPDGYIGPLTIVKTQMAPGIFTSKTWLPGKSAVL